MLWSKKQLYRNAPYDLEEELESAILEVRQSLFGNSRLYLDVKKKIGGKGKRQNIPDGYLIDLSSKQKPVLHVVEVELASHDPIKHIAVQILEFSLAFENDAQKVKQVVRDALEINAGDRQFCEQYARNNGFENVDYLLERMIYGGGFGALVIIDDLVDELESVLMSKFKFGVEVIELKRFCAEDGSYMYEFEPFLADLEQSDSGARIDLSEVDTIVVPANADGFLEVFVGQDRWYAIRIHGSMMPKIKYIAGYQTAPTSAITHIADVASIEQWRDTKKYIVNFRGAARKIGPLALVKKGKVKAPQGPRYTSVDRIRNANTLDDVF